MCVNIARIEPSDAQAESLFFSTQIHIRASSHVVSSENSPSDDEAIRLESRSAKWSAMRIVVDRRNLARKIEGATTPSTALLRGISRRPYKFADRPIYSVETRWEPARQKRFHFHFHERGVSPLAREKRVR